MVLTMADGGEVEIEDDIEAVPECSGSARRGSLVRLEEDDDARDPPVGTTAAATAAALLSPRPTEEVRPGIVATTIGKDERGGGKDVDGGA